MSAGTFSEMFSDRPVRAIFWDFGGVITSSPFEAFRQYEGERGLPADFIRTVNSRNPDSKAWAQLERNDVDIPTFCRLFEKEAAALGHAVPGEDVLARLSGTVRPEMAQALARLQGRYKLACLTNNVLSGAGPGMAPTSQRAREIAQVMTVFDAIVESSKVGVRKPEPKFYEIACEIMEVEPNEVVFLDDLGINLKPAKATGMRTIKVTSAAQGLADLERLLGCPLR